MEQKKIAPSKMNKKTGGGKILNEIAMRVFEIHTIYPMYYVIRMHCGHP